MRHLFRTLGGAAAALALALPVLPAAPAAAAPAAAGPPAVVATDRGLVRGEVRRDHRLFQGIPYARPPVGGLRWSPPQPPEPWPGVYDATFPRSQCAQPAASYGGEATFEEDCLYLNVTTPAPGRDSGGGGRSGPGLPVMVWVHGGSNVTGSGSRYDAAKLAVEGDVVVVTVNYRLGALGFLAHPALEGEGGASARQSGNYGLLDQQAALHWVQRNAAAFGGDPDNVTLFGESAGAADTCANLASPAAAGLFDRAIAQSYSCTSPMRPERAAEAAGDRFAQAVGCTTDSAARTAACLRDLTAKELVTAFEELGERAYPVVGGGGVLPLQPRDAIEQGRFNRVPVMHGNTLDEMRLYVGLRHPQPITVRAYEDIVRAAYGDRADSVLARYPAEDYPSPRIALATLQTHHGGVLSTCEHLDAYRLLARSGVPVHAYQFADRDAPPLIDVPGFDEGAEHATELTYLFPGLLGELDARQQRLSTAMVGYWTSFAHGRAPEARRAPHWPRFRSAGDVLSLAPGPEGVRTIDVAAESNCGFWKSFSR